VKEKNCPVTHVRHSEIEFIQDHHNRCIRNNKDKLEFIVKNQGGAQRIGKIIKERGNFG
jgi:hypothetical protein